jgi:hypothetical protein
VWNGYLSHTSTNPNQPTVWKAWVEDDEIKFHLPDADGPDALVKICITLIIPAVLDAHKGITGLCQ